MNGVALAAAAICMVGAAGPDEEFSSAFIEKTYERVSPAICVISYSSEITNPATGESSKRGTNALGLLVSADGLVMTHGHMQLEYSRPFGVRVKVRQGEAEKEYDAKPLSKPDDVNISFVKIENAGSVHFPHVRFQRGATLQLGEPVLLLGILGEGFDYNRTLMVRRIGSILEKPRQTYCLDQPIPFGYVSGPVINGRGEIVGVAGYDLSPAEGGELYIRSGHPLVYQTDLFVKYLDHPLGEEEEKAADDDAWVGIFTQPLSDDFAEYWGLEKNGGIVVSNVVAGSPGEAAGLQRGDVIVNFDGTPIHAKQDREVLDFTRLIRESGVGREVKVKVLRNGQPVELPIKLVSRPKSARDAGEFEDEVFGLTVREITTDLRIRLNLTEDVKGVIVRRVKSGSWAAQANIRPGVIIMNFGEYPVTSLDDFKQAVAQVQEQKPSEVTVFCRVGPVTGFFRMQPLWPSNAPK